MIVNIEKVQSYWSEDKSRIYTQIDLKIKETLKGNLAVDQIINLKLYGGTVGNITTAVIGGPEFFAGHSCILFLSTPNNSQAKYILSCSTQGKFSIFTNEKSGQIEVK